MITPYLSYFWTMVFLFLSAFFSASETALFSIPRERIPFFRQSGQKNHQQIFALLQDGQQTLMLILLGNLFVNVTLVGCVHAVLAQHGFHNTIILTMIVATGVILLFGEILPKNIAIRNSEAVARLTAPGLYSMRTAVSPVLKIMQKLNIFFLTGLSRHLRKPSPYITLEEFRSSFADSTMRGVVSADEWRILQGVFEAADMPVSQMMTHRSFLACVSPEQTAQETLAVMTRRDQAVCCVTDDVDIDEIQGLVYCADAMRCPSYTAVKEIMAPPVWVAETSEVADLIGFMFRGKNLDVCVHDEFGVFVGIFSLNTGINNILMMTSSEQASAPSGGMATRRFHGLAELKDMQEWIPPSLRETDKSVRTLNGLLTRYLGRIPKTGETVALDGWNFYIIESKPNAVESVLIKKEGV